MATKIEEVFVEIKAVHKRRTAIYRFFGRGEWKVNYGAGWRPLDGIYVPGEVLKVAALHCEPAPPLCHPALLTEREIAGLCGGQG